MPFTFLFKKKSTFSFLFSKYYLLENYQWRFVFLIQTDIEWKHGGQLWWVSRTVGAVALWSPPPAVVPTRVGGNPSSKQALLMTWKKLRVDILFVNIAYFRMIINQIDINRWRVILWLDTRCLNTYLDINMYIVGLNMKLIYKFTGIVLICLLQVKLFC